MALVSYSDSEGSEDETPQQPPKPTPASASASAGLQPSTDKSQTRKIRVNFTETQTDPTSEDVANRGEPPYKRARLGAGAFSGFNSLLPPPKRTGAAATQTPTNKGTPRKVFSLRTGAEPGFDRSADAELRQLFEEQEQDTNGRSSNSDPRTLTNGGQAADQSSSTVTEPRRKGNAMMFKPLSVARNPQKKKKIPATSVQSNAGPPPSLASSVTTSSSNRTPAPKTSLFSLQKDMENPAPTMVKSDNYEPIVYNGEQDPDDLGDDSVEESAYQDPTDFAGDGEKVNVPATSQSLDFIADDLKLSASAKRQLFGRNAGKLMANAVNVVNFNTDEEYAANEVLRANGEQVQHNPVKAIAPGKHSLRQLITAATGQREALEESFAAGKRNKKEAGSKYGW